MRGIFICILLSFLLMKSFSQARVTVADYQKVQEPAIENDLPFPTEMITNALQDMLEKKGYKGKISKDFMLYKSVRLPELGSEAHDLYFKAERKSKKDKDNSIITMMIAKGAGFFLSEANDTTLINNAKKYLDNLIPVIEAYDLEQQIKEQEDVLKKADKKMSALLEDNEDLTKKKKKLEDQIAENLAGQGIQKTEVDKQKQILDTLKGKRKMEIKN